MTLNPFLWDVSPCHWLIDVRRFGTAQWSRFQGPNAKVPVSSGIYVKRKQTENNIKMMGKFSDK